MKKFKAMIAATAAVMALSAVSVPMSAFASEERVAHPNPQVYGFNGVGEWQDPKNDDMNDQPSTKVNVDFSIEPTYVVTIPADVRIASGSREERNSVQVMNVFLNKGKAVEVSVASQNAYEMKLNLEGGVLDSANKIPYSLRGRFTVGTTFAGQGDIAYPTGEGDITIVDRNQEFNRIITVPTGSKNEPGLGVAQLTYSISNDQDIPVAGTYSDRLTFKIAVVDAQTNGNNQP